MMVASIFAGDLGAFCNAGSGYQVMTSIEEMGSAPRLTTMLAKLLAVVASRSLSSQHEQVAD